MSEAVHIFASQKADIGYDSRETRYSAETIQRNFYLMCLSFSLTHGSVVTCLAYASSILGESLGSSYSGIQYIVFAVTALFFAKPIVNMMGTLPALTISLIGNTVYVAGFFFALLLLDYVTLSWIMISFAAVIGGIASGVLWTAQGRFFTQHAVMYSQMAGISTETITSEFASIFAVIFLGGEVILKLAATILYIVLPSHGTFLIFLVFTILSIFGCVMLSFLDDLDESGTLDLSYNTITQEMGSATRLVLVDKRLLLLVPFQAAFGLASSFVLYYVFGTVVGKSPTLGNAWIGFFSAVIVFSGAIASIPAATIANYYGKHTVITIGSIALVLSCGMFLMFSNQTIGTWEGMIAFCIIQGIGRGVWENTNKAVIADFYGDDKEKCLSAFSATSFFTAYAAAMGYFSFPYIPRIDKALVCVIAGIVSLICYKVAFHIQNVLKQQSFDRLHVLQLNYRQHLEHEKQAQRHNRNKPVSSIALTSIPVTSNSRNVKTTDLPHDRIPLLSSTAVDL